MTGFRKGDFHFLIGHACYDPPAEGLMVNHIVGASDTYGSAMGLGAAVCSGYEGTGKPYQIPYPCPDGLLVAGAWVYGYLRPRLPH